MNKMALSYIVLGRKNTSFIHGIEVRVSENEVESAGLCQCLVFCQTVSM